MISRKPVDQSSRACTHIFSIYMAIAVSESSRNIYFCNFYDYFDGKKRQKSKLNFRRDGIF